MGYCQAVSVRDGWLRYSYFKPPPEIRHFDITDNRAKKPGSIVSPVCTGTVVIRPSGCLRKRGCRELRTSSQPYLSKNSHDLFALHAWEAGHAEICWMPASSSELRSVIRLQAQFNHFSGALHEGIQILSLRMTAGHIALRRVFAGVALLLPLLANEARSGASATAGSQSECRCPPVSRSLLFPDR